MRKLLILNSILILSLLGLNACNGTGTANLTNTNTLNANTINVNLVGVNSLPNTNTVNANLPNTNSTGNMTGMNMGDNPTDARGFMTLAAQSGMAEVEISQIAATKAQNAEVRQFAQRMVNDHTKANNELKQLAQKEGLTLPTEIDAEHRQIRERLSQLSGAEFDREFMNRQVEHHQRDVNLFQNQADNGDDAEVKAFAAKNLPTLRQHLEMAQSINGKIK